MMCHTLMGSIRCSVNCAEQSFSAAAVGAAPGSQGEDYSAEEGFR